MKKGMITALLGLALYHAQATAKEVLPYQNPKLSIEQRVNDLIGRMTLEEKVWQLNQYTLGTNNNVNNIGDEVTKVPARIGSVILFAEDAVLRNRLQKKAVEETRLGIPVLFGFDVIHGFRTIYPIPLAQACSWNPALSGECGQMAAKEARMSGTDWTFSPMIDVARDGRWGRVAEGYGEDPYTNAVFAAAAVKAYQGDTLASTATMAACLKHYLAYGASEAGRDYVYTEVSPQTLWDTYIPPYEAGVKAGAATLMSGFNCMNGTPATSNHYTLTEILKNRWRHDGFVVSDWHAVDQLINQGVAADKKEAAALAINAGLEMDMLGDCYSAHLAELVNEGKVSMQRVDDAVRRVLRIKFRLGLFEKPYTKELDAGKRILFPAYRQVSERMAKETMVLLQNANGVLPLSRPASIALIGPLAKDHENLLGSWKAHGRAENVCSIYDAMVREFPGTHIRYAQGCDFEGENRSGFDEAIAAAKQSDVVVLCLGEKREWSGENASRSTLALPAIQEELLTRLKEATGKSVVVLLSNGRPLELVRITRQADAVVEMWQPGVSGGIPVAGILSGRVNPSGRLAITFPYSTGQIPIYYNQRPTARTGTQGRYQDIPSTPLYEFGYGLSYTIYKYGSLKVSASRVSPEGKLTAEIDVTNTGTRDGMETVHWFINDPVCTITRPVKELRHFEKKLLKAGETQTFRFEIDPKRDLGYVDGDGRRFLERGTYYIMVKDQKVKITVE